MLYQFIHFSSPYSSLPYVCVSPLSHDFTEWHGNLKGPEGTPYEGGVFHFSIQFQHDHPRYVTSTFVQWACSVVNRNVLYRILTRDIHAYVVLRFNLA